MKGTMLLDIEVYPDLFFVGVKDLKEHTIYTFEISHRKDERVRLYKFLKEFKGFLVTFNGLHYDEVVLKYFLQKYKVLKDEQVDDFLYAIKDFSDDVISDNENVKPVRYLKTTWTSIDLFLYWSMNLRLSKQISLKSLGIQLNHEEVQELPFPINHYFKGNDEQIETLIHYNVKNDLGILEKLLSRMKGDVELRHYVLKTYGVNAWSLDAPKIASEYLLEDYCSKTFTGDVSDFREYNEYKKSVRNSRYEPAPFVLKDYIPEVEFTEPFFKEIYEKFQQCRGKYYEVLWLKKNDTDMIIMPSIGGIHSKNDNEIYESDNEWVIIDADIASLYPNLFKNYKFLRKSLQIVLDKYVEIIDDRIEAKRSGNKLKDKFLKLILNSFSGLADSSTNWVYSPSELLALRVTGQLIQLRFIEELTNHKGFKVFFTNTLH